MEMDEYYYTSSILPILVTIPFGDSEEEGKSQERQEYENKLIDAILKDEDLEEGEAFYDTWYFYPYKNPNPRGQALTPYQLYNVLKDEIKLFLLPEINSKEEFEKTFKNGSCTYLPKECRQLFIPPHNDKRTGEPVVSKEQPKKWEKDRIVLVADDLKCDWVKIFQVSTFDIFRRKGREFKRAGMELNVKYDDGHFFQYENASDSEEVEDDRNHTKRWTIKNDYDGTDENSIAAQWLGLPSGRYCAMHGINAGYMEADMVSISRVNLDEGNMFFTEMVTLPYSVDEEGMKKLIEEL